MQDKTDSPLEFSKRVNAGKRTYFFDIKSSRSGDYYIVLTESKKRTTDSGSVFEKHKIFLYKEDVNKFVSAFEEVVSHLKENMLPDFDFDKASSEYEDVDVD
jgi:hypothetical protein